ncbi:MAG: hypothetical protein ACLTQH_00880 [Fusobacterium sp.]
MGIKVNDDREELPYKLGIELELPVYSHILSVEMKKIILLQRRKEETIDKIKISKKNFCFQ